jgi:hypothetical protein
VRAHHAVRAIGERTESQGSVQLTLPMPTTRYVDQLLSSRCREELIMNRVFPNAKEVTESFAAVDAARRWAAVGFDDDDVTAVVVGDGSTPRTAATLALRTRWRCLSVDPALRPDRVAEWPLPIRRLELRSQRVQALDEPIDGRCIVLAVHAHVELQKAVAAVERCGGDVVAAVAICCCGYRHDLTGYDLAADFEDWGIWSPERRVRVWTQAVPRPPSSAGPSTEGRSRGH